MTQSVRLSLTLRPDDLSHRPEHALGIAKVSLAWTNVEEVMADLFSLGMKGAEPAVAAAVMGCIANLTTRLAMIRTALSLGWSDEAGKAFNKLEEPIRKAAKRRNKVVHSLWTIHPDYPDDLIRAGGITDPALGSEVFRLADFQEIELALVKLHLSLRVFCDSLPSVHPARDPEVRPPFWQYAEPSLSKEDNPNR